MKRKSFSQGFGKDHMRTLSSKVFLTKSYIRARVVVAALAVACAGSALGQTKLAPPMDEAALEQKITSLLQRLTTEQKLQLIGGTNGMYTFAEPSIGLPRFRMADGPVGIRGTEPATAFPAGIALAATFDTEVAFEEGAALGRVAHARGINFLLGPGVNLYRSPLNGRNFEYFGEDPFLASSMAVDYIRGVQKQGVAATVKHFALNNEEYDRHHIDSIVDERTLRELYLPAFEAAVTVGHVDAVMDSYNLVNGVHASQNAMLNRTILKGEWGFKGLVMSDWNSVYDGLAAANTGLDLEMPSGKFMTASTLRPALASGSLPVATLDDKVRRLLRVALREGWMGAAPLASTPAATPLEDPADRAVARRVALESITLLKNDNQVLPLETAKVCTLAVIGPNADKPVVGGGGSAQVTPFAAASTLDALSAALPKTAACPGVVYARGLPTMAEIFSTSSFTHGIAEQLFATRDATGVASARIRDHLVPGAATPGSVPSGAVSSAASDVHSGRWVADYTPAASGPVLVFAALGTQDSLHLKVNGTEVLAIMEPEGKPIGSATVAGIANQPLHLELTATLRNDASGMGLGVRPLAAMVSEEAKALASRADAVVLTAGYDPHTEGEGFDRTFSLPAGQDELIRDVASRNPRTIVAVDAGGGFDMAPWLPKVAAVVHLWYPGEEGAPALADLLFGRANPEGHLPVSIEHSLSENPTHDSYFPGAGSTPDHPTIKLDEGVFLGYRYYASLGVKPLFPFGFGLSYTSFTFSNLHATSTAQGVIVSLDVKNTGARKGGEAVQIYVSDPSATVKRPVEELKAFRKVHLEPKEAAHVEFTLDRRAFSWWNPATHSWQVDPGKFVLLAGDSSDHLPLSAVIDLQGLVQRASEQTGVAQTALSQPAAEQAANTQRLLFATNPAPAYSGAAEFSLIVQSIRNQTIEGKDSWTAPQSNKTRVIEQLAGFTPRVLPTDKWGGRLDISQPATGFFYTHKIGDRWWAIDPAGHAYFHMAVVELSPSGSPNAKAALANAYGTNAAWMAKTHGLMLANGFNGTGAWSNLDLLRNSPLQASHPLAYTVILNLMADYGKKRGGLHDTPGHAGFPNDTIFVFDPEFPKFVEHAAESIRKYADDSNVFGYFSDNELPLSRSNLDGYLGLPHEDPGYIAARKWMSDHNVSKPTDESRKQFLAYEVDLYYSIAFAAIRHADPNHMYLGSRITGKTELCPEVFRVLGKYADAIAVNYYNSWTPDAQLLAMWERESGKPEIITEWYVKGNDSGMPNKTGAGWLVGTQAQRGAFYQNYALELIQSKSIVGWHWFKYQDNDPNDPHAELSNKDSNKGIVNIRYQVYGPLMDRMRQLNPNAYALADYFDARSKASSPAQSAEAKP